MMGDEPEFSSRDPSQGFNDGLSARALLSSIRRHLRVVLTLSLSLCAAGALIGLGLPPWFQAGTVLIIHARPQRMTDVQELPDPVPDIPIVRSETDVLRSRSVIEPVVRSLGLWRLPEFQDMEYPGGWSWQNVEVRLRSLWGVASGGEADSRDLPGVSAQPDDASPHATIDEVIEKYARYLLVETDGQSMTIRVSYRAWTPERAATIVNAHIESYQNLQEQDKARAAQRANSALNAQITELRKTLQAAEAVVTRYREEHHLTGAAKDSAALSQQLANLNSQLIVARADRAGNEAPAAQIGVGHGAADSIPEVIANGTSQ